MLEKILIDYFAEETPTPIYAEVPENPPANFLVIERTGGGSDNLINSATIAIQSYSDTLYGAAQLNEEIKTIMEDATTLSEVARVDLNSDYNFTDTSTKRYRYQAIFDVIYY